MAKRDETSTSMDASPLAHLDTRLLAARARAEILRAIFDGRFEGKLPNEDRLAEQLKISRTTVRTALQGLERDGIITRRRAIGTIINAHVRPSSLALQRLTGFDSLLQERGHDVTVNIAWHWADVGPTFAAAFGIDPDLACCIIEKRYLADGTNALMITDAVRRDAIADDIPSGEIEASLFAFSEARCRAPIHHAAVEIVPMAKAPGVTELVIPDGTPFIRLHETHYTADADPIAHSIIDANDSFIRLEVIRTQ